MLKIVILGAGPGGYVAAVRAAQLGADVTVIETDNPGGTCLNHGCIPSKIMITTGELLTKAQNAEAFGLTIAGGIRPNMPRLMERKNRVIETQRKGILDLLKHNRVRYLQGTGLIKGKYLAAVKTPEGEVIDVSWDKLILATGTRPIDLPNLTFNGERIISSNDALALQEIPEALLIVGGGVIGCEFACLFSALGSKVTVVEALDRLLPLPSMDEDCSKVLQREMKKRKINIIVGHTVEGCDEQAGRLRVTIGRSPFLKNPDDKSSKPLYEVVDKILVCVGRASNAATIEGFDLLNIKLDEKGWVPADTYLQTSAPDVYAIGDLLGPSKIMLAHVASTEGLAAAENTMGGCSEMDYRIVPSAIFTSPEVAGVGLTETQARALGGNVRADSVLFRTLGKAQVLGEIAGQAKIVSENGSGKILGVHMIGPHVTDLIAEATLAIKLGATATDLAHTIHAHPTLSEIMLETALKTLDRSIHG